MSRIRLLLCAAVAGSTLAGALAIPTQAMASHGQIVYFEAPGALLQASTRAKTIKQLQGLGVKALRVELYWEDVAPDPNHAKSPANFTASEPADYNWGEYEPLLAEAKKLHWPVLLTVTGPGPKWVTQSKSRPYVLRPNAEDYKEFMTAVGRKFGSEVSLFAIWNEPNDPAFLQPQFNSNGSAASPRIYRELFQNGYAGLQAAGISHPKVLMGETEPAGTDTRPRGGNGLSDVAPLALLRGALCLNESYKKASTCGSLPAYGFATHPYTTAAGPFYVPPGKDEVMIGVLGRLVNALNLAAKAGAIKANMPIYLTEFGVQSKPNVYLGVSVQKQAEYDAIAEKIAYENPRVAAFSQYLLRDDPVGDKPGSSVEGGTVGFQTGLENVNGRPKPLYDSWPVPLVVTTEKHGYSLWGLIRPTTKATTATIMVKTPGAKSFRVLKTVHTNSLGYWTLNSSVKGVEWKVKWTSPAHRVYEGDGIGATPAS